MDKHLGKKLIALIPWGLLSVVLAAPPYEWSLMSRALGMGVMGGLWLTLLFPGDSDAPPTRKLD